jgi:hypothetical protein
VSGPPPTGPPTGPLPSGPAPGPPPAPARRADGLLDRRVVVGALIALLVIGLAIGGVVALSGGGGGTAGASVRTEPVSSSNNPFAPPQGTDMPPTQPVMPGSNFQTQGGAQGLYGGTLNQAVCDKSQLTTYLQSNPDKATAWAGVLGIQVSDIPTYVNRLAPVILRSDTLVTNHGFSNGRATAFVSVLQAGTAVLVDDKGEPVTKCYCGNPLTSPPYYSSPPTYYGPTWSYWHGGRDYTSVTANTTVINVFVLVDVHTNTTIYLVPGGTTPTATNPTIPTTTPTTAETLPPQSAPPRTSPPRTNPPTTSPPTTQGCPANDDDSAPNNATSPEEMAEDAAGCS